MTREVGPLHAQVQLWAETGEHRIEVSYDQKVGDGGVSAWEEPVQNHSEPRPSADNTAQASSTIASTSIGSSTDGPQHLVGVHGDCIIPEPSQIARVYNQGRHTWSQFVSSAQSLPPHTLPSGTADPTIMLKDVPALPSNLAGISLLEGNPVWRVPDVQDDDAEDQDADELAAPDSSQTGFAMSEPYGLHYYFHLSYPTPITCHILKANAQRPSGMATPGLPVLTLCWSYIICARLLELQGRSVIYTENALKPRHKMCLELDDPSHIIKLDLGIPATPKLVAWLCAVLAPRPAWASSKPNRRAPYAPWAAHLTDTDSEDADADAVRFTVYVDNPTRNYKQERPPTSSEAVELLIGFCGLFGLGRAAHRRRGRPRKDVSELAPVTAAFLAALSLPFYRHVELQPRFTRFTLEKTYPISRDSLELVQSLADDLPYYMTLSLQPRIVGSLLWSIFWQPDIECNLVSSWLGAIRHVLQPILDAGNTELLAKIFVYRRPRVGLWWLGVLLLNSSRIPELILRYLDTLEERYGYGSTGAPDTVASAWSGSPQSFLDQAVLGTYNDMEDTVPLVDLFRYRYSLRLQDSTRTALAWKPFGSLPKTEIEIDLWPWLEKDNARTYVHWAWWLRKKGVVSRDIQRGFRHDTGRFSTDVPDRLDMIDAGDNIASESVAPVDAIKLEPSLNSTIRMMSHCMANQDNTGRLPMEPDEAEQHPWLKDSRLFG